MNEPNSVWLLLHDFDDQVTTYAHATLAGALTTVDRIVADALRVADDATLVGDHADFVRRLGDGEDGEWNVVAGAAATLVLDGLAGESVQIRYEMVLD